MKALTTVVGAGALVLAIDACDQTPTTNPPGSANAPGNGNAIASADREVVSERQDGAVMTKPIPGRPVGSPQPAGRRPYRWLRAAVAAAGVLALAGCGSTTAMNAAQDGVSTPASSAPTSTPSPSTSALVTSAVQAPRGTSTPPPSPGTSAPPVKATGQPVPPNQVSYAAAAENTPQTVWEQDGGKTLVLMAEEGGCVKVEAQVPKQTADEVDVVLLSTAQTHRMCPLYVRNIPVAAHLDAPLGNRKLVVATQTR